MKMEGPPEDMSWSQSLHLRKNEDVVKWFTLEIYAELRNSPILAAISTLFLDQYIAGHAIKLALKLLNLNLGPD